MRSFGPKVDIKLRIFGGFVFKKRKGVEYQVYEAGFVYWKLNVYMSYIKLGYLRYLCGEGIKNMGWEIPQDYVLWFKEKGKTWMTGKRRMDNDDDVKAFMEEAKHKDGYYELFCTVSIDPSEVDNEQPISNPPTSDSPNKHTHKGPNTSSEPTTQLTPQKSQKSSVSTSRKSPRLNLNPENNLSQSVAIQTNIGQSQTTPKKSLVEAIPVRRSPRITSVGSGSDLGESVRDKGKGKVLRLEKVKEKVVDLDKDDESGSESGSGSYSGSDSDLDVDWEAGEEEEDDNEEQQWFLESRNLISGEVEASLNILRQIGESSGAIVSKSKKVVEQVSKDIYDAGKIIIVQEEPSDSDEQVSLHGSDEELDDSPWFREETDFNKPIVLVNKQQFSSASVLRRALRTHAIENRYEYYYLHNGGNRITTFCKRRCGCEWNPRRSNLPECKCSAEVRKCDFKVSARRQYNSCVWQIKDLWVKHRCMRSKMNSKVTAEYLAEKYLEEWRSNPLWEIKSFQDRILNDLGIKVRYSKAYLARTRVKFMIYGSCSEHCIVQQSRGDFYEVTLNGDQVSVDLGARTCTCYHWQLTGIPCVHGFACMLDKRVDPEAYVDKFYSMEKYLQAYDDVIQPMPGPKHWEKCDLRKPLPPPIRVMPGRPKSKKRKRERGEGVPESSGREPKSMKRQSRCKSCGQLGHYAKTCKNSSAVTTPKSEPKKPAGKPILQTPWMKEQRRKREERAAWKTAEGAGPWSIANKPRPSQGSASTQPSQASQASTTTTTTRSKAKSILMQGSQKKK